MTDSFEPSIHRRYNKKPTELRSWTAEGGCPYIRICHRLSIAGASLTSSEMTRRISFTFCTYRGWMLPEHARSIALESCLHDNGTRFDLRVAVVMPDHVHMIFTPQIDAQAMEVYSLADIMDAVKGASSHKINKVLGRKGRVWQTESFDHVLRSSESLDAKVQYLLENPVRQGLVNEWTRYSWLWVKPFVNPFALVR